MHGCFITKSSTIGNDCKMRQTNVSKVMFKESINYLKRYKMESIYIKTMMKGQGSLELAIEMQTERKQEWQFTHLVQTYLRAFMNDLGFVNRKVFYRL